MASRNELEKILKGFLYLFFERECVRDRGSRQRERKSEPRADSVLSALTFLPLTS